MKITTSALILVIFLCGEANSQPHIHDKAELLISQQDALWNLQFIVPAINAFGFEHLPESKMQKQVVKNFVQQVKQISNVLSLNGKCALTSSDESISNTYLIESNKPYGHSSDEKYKGEHLDAKFSYTFNCRTPMTGMELKLFSLIKGLNELSIQWITDSGQGAVSLYRNDPKFKF